MQFLSEISKYAWMFSLTSIFLVFLGWKITYKNQMKMATRSESKSILDSLAKVINEIADISISYWLKKCSELAMAEENNLIKSEAASAEYIMAVLAKSRQAVEYFDLLNSRGIDLQKSQVADVLEKCTLDCETAMKRTSGDRAMRMNEIMDVCMSILEACYSRFHEIYPPSSHQTSVSMIKNKLNEMDAWYKNLNP